MLDRHGLKERYVLIGKTRSGKSSFIHHYIMEAISEGKIVEFRNNGYYIIDPPGKLNYPNAIDGSLKGAIVDA